MSEILELESIGGNHISSVCSQATDLAHQNSKPVHFVFNGTHVTVNPGDKPEAVQAKWSADCQAAADAYRASPEFKKREKERAAEENRKRTAHLTAEGTTEAELRAEEVPWPYTSKQLAEYIESLVSKNHDYGTCCYAMSMAAEAAFNYVSHCLGVTGFQASCADLDFLRRTRSLKGPFLIIKAEDALYPQYDLREKLEDFLQSVKPWLKEEAERNLANMPIAHQDVIAHWKNLAEKK